MSQTADDFVRGAVPLHSCRANHDMRVGVAAFKDVQHITNCGTVDRRDDTDLSWQGWQRPFPILVEQPFSCQAFAKLLERELQGTQTLRLNVITDDLILALRGVDADTPSCDDMLTVLRLETKVPQCRAEHYAVQLSVRVFQGEVQMSGLPHARV